MTQPHDIWHANDATGIYQTPTLHDISQTFTEGVSLGEGEIPQVQLNTLIREGLKRAIKFVIEVNENNIVRSPNA